MLKVDILYILKKLKHDKVNYDFFINNDPYLTLPGSIILKKWKKVNETSTNLTLTSCCCCCSSSSSSNSLRIESRVRSGKEIEQRRMQYRF